MALSDFVFEIIMDEWPEWDGNRLYTTKELAEYFGIQDFENAFYSKWKAGYEDAEEPGEFKWEPIGRGFYYLYEDGNPTGVSLRFRYVHSGDDE